MMRTEEEEEEEKTNEWQCWVLRVHGEAGKESVILCVQIQSRL